MFGTQPANDSRPAAPIVFAKDAVQFRKWAADCRARNDLVAAEAFEYLFHRYRRAVIHATA